MIVKQSPLTFRIRKKEEWKSWHPNPQDIRKDQTPRQRLLIQIRVYLERRQSLLLKTPRWSEPQLFWDRVLGAKNKVCQLQTPSPQLSLAEQWRHLLKQLGVIEEAPRVLKFVAERSGFRSALTSALGDLQNPILIRHAERWPLSILADIQHVWADLNSRERPALLISGSIQGGQVDHQLWLPDLSMEESFKFLRASPDSRFKEYIYRTGGVPALLNLLKPLISKKEISRAMVDSAWESLLGEAQRIVDHLATDSRPYMRLESIIRAGAQPFLYVLDQPLIESGLVRKVRRGSKSYSVLRAPIFARCVHSD